MRIVAGLMIVSIGAMMVPPAFALSQASPSESGLQISSSANGPWATGIPSDGQWIRANSSDGAVVDFGGGCSARLAEGSRVHWEHSKSSLKLSGLDGRMFVKLDGARAAEVSLAAAKVSATQGEFVVDSVTKAGLQVVTGDAAAIYTPQVMKSMLDSRQIALDGPDVRTRKADADEFNRKKRRKKNAADAANRLHKLAPVNHTPPPVAEPPADIPPATVTPPPAVPPAVIPPETAVIPAAGGGGGAVGLIVLGSLVLVGGVVAIALTHHNNNNTVTVPASP
jgi:hypothetical protein